MSSSSWQLKRERDKTLKFIAGAHTRTPSTRVRSFIFANLARFVIAVCYNCFIVHTVVIYIWWPKIHTFTKIVRMEKKFSNPNPRFLVQEMLSPLSRTKKREREKGTVHTITMCVTPIPRLKNDRGTIFGILATDPHCHLSWNGWN
jgi:hypothetical protein